MNRLNARKVDPVFVEASTDAGKALLRIGEARPGESRIAVLDAGELRTLAYMLLLAAEDLDAARKAKP